MLGARRHLLLAPEEVGEYLPIREELKRDGEERVPTKEAPVVAGEFPLRLLIIIPPGTKLPGEAAVLPRPVMAPDSLVLHCTKPTAGHLSPFLAPRLPHSEAKWAAAHRLTVSPGTKGTSPECSMATRGVSWPRDPTAF